MVGTLEPIPHPQLPVHSSSGVQFLVQVTDLPEFKPAPAVSGPPWRLAHSPSWFPALAFVHPSVLTLPSEVFPEPRGR